MKDFLRKHGKKTAWSAISIGATGAAYYYLGPAGAAKVQEMLPALLELVAPVLQ